MTDRDLIIVEKAFGLFAHYGVAKTSMSEIATASGVARQTLYNAFQSKEDLIFAALMHYGAKTKSDIERDCAKTYEIQERLEILLRHMGVIPFELMQTLPHLDEVLAISERLPGEKKHQIKANYLGAIRLVLAPFEADLKRAGVDPNALQAMIKACFTQIKRDAQNEADLRALYAPLAKMIIATVGANAR